jgi:hypothetical protein
LPGGRSDPASRFLAILRSRPHLENKDNSKIFTAAVSLDRSVIAVVKRGLHGGERRDAITRGRFQDNLPPDFAARRQQ